MNTKLARPRSAADGVVIVGAGGFGREALDACLAGGIAVVGFVDDSPRGVVRSLPVSSVSAWAGRGPAVIAVADPAARISLAERLERLRIPYPTIIDPRAVVGPESSVGDGSIILANAFISSSVRLGDHVHINYGVTLGHDTAVDSFTTILPGANVGGGVKIGESSTIGANATILQQLRIGRNATVGAGAVVTRDVLDGQVVVGTPARELHR